MVNLLSPQQKNILGRLAKFLSPGYQLPYAIPGHDIGHVERMCRLAHLIWSDDRGCDPFLLLAAIWFHNIDRTSYRYFDLFKNDPRYDYDEKVIREWCSLYPDAFSLPDIDILVDAMHRHNRLNDDGGPDDSVLVYLKDCDRLDRMGLIGVADIIRHSTQKGHPLYCIPEDFDCRYDSTSESALTSVMHNFTRTKEWVEMLRVPKAREIAQKRIRLFDSFMHGIEDELRDLGLL